MIRTLFSARSAGAFILACSMLSVAPGLAQRPSGLRSIRSHRPSATQAATATLPAAASYRFTVLDYPGTLETAGFGINSGAASSKTEIVGAPGSINDPGPVGYRGGFLMPYTKTSAGVTETYRAVNFPGTKQQAASGINDSGQIVGYYADSSNVIHGYMQSGGTFTTIDVPFSGAASTGAFGINNSGQIVGYWNDVSTSHGFLLSGGTYTSMDYPGAVFTIANAINNLGDIVGIYSDTSGAYHGFLLSGGTYTSLDPPGSTATEAYGINDSGDIAGLYCLTSECAANLDTYQGFVLSGGTYGAVTIPGATSIAAIGINNKGTIVGVYYDSVGNHGFLAIP